MTTSTKYLAAQSAHLDTWKACFENQSEAAPIDTAEIQKIMVLVVRQWRGWSSDLTEGVAEDARCIRSDWAQVGKDLRKAIARMGDELHLEDAVG